MPEQQASRTLVKSGPELWAECSEAASLAKHLGEFGEIRITKLDPENTVAWEGGAVSGTVKLEAAGWGTRVTLTVRDARQPGIPELSAAAAPGPEVAVEPEPEVTPETTPLPEPGAVTAPEDQPARPGFLTRLFSAFRRAPVSEDAEDAEHPGDTEDVAREEMVPAEVLDAALDSLGRAHRKPYSRA